MKSIVLFTALLLFTCLSFAQKNPNPTAVIDSSQRNQNKHFTVNGVSFEMVAVVGGSFLMGCTDEQTRSSSEKPAHKVRVSDFSIGKHEVTQALWQAVMGTNPSSFKGDNRPVETVSWLDCRKFVTKLNQLTGVEFRLPSEAEWEYAARGGSASRGTQYAGSANVYEVAWFGENAGSTTHEVGLLRPNELGIHDMSGNVREWCSNWYGDGFVIQSDPQDADASAFCTLRGGSWLSEVVFTRIASRIPHRPDFKISYYGFRLVLGE